MIGQKISAKYPSHFILYTSNILDPIFIKKLTFPNTEKIISDKNFFLLIAKTIRATTKETARSTRLICKSSAGSEKNIIFLRTSPKICESVFVLIFTSLLSHKNKRL